MKIHLSEIVQYLYDNEQLSAPISLIKNYLLSLARNAGFRISPTESTFHSGPLSYLCFIVNHSRDNRKLASSQSLQDESGRLHKGRMITGKILGKQYIINGIAAEVSDFKPGMSADTYYEVVRMIDGKYLFLQDHIDRLQHSLSGSGLDQPNAESITESLRLLQLSNDFTFGNIRICIQKKPDEGRDLLCYFIPYFYPELCMYKSGVQLVTYPHVRPNPGIKKWDGRFRSSVSKYIRDHGVYEAVLTNNQKQITEGSRSNIFFLNDGNRLITPPEKNILPGITRKHVFSICNEEGIEVIERPVLLDELDEMTSCFISGTSPKILPVWQLDGFQFAVDHPVLALLMDRFEVLVKENLVSLVPNDPK